MTMETRKEIAAEKKRCGSHNCTQAVLCTYHDFIGMDEETIKNAKAMPLLQVWVTWREPAEPSLALASYLDSQHKTRRSLSRA